jgi:hypothetical protein
MVTYSIENSGDAQIDSRIVAAAQITCLDATNEIIPWRLNESAVQSDHFFTDCKGARYAAAYFLSWRGDQW